MKMLLSPTLISAVSKWSGADDFSLLVGCAEACRDRTADVRAAPEAAVMVRSTLRRSISVWSVILISLRELLIASDRHCWPTYSGSSRCRDVAGLKSSGAIRFIH